MSAALNNYASPVSNIGKWLGAKVYRDTKSNVCSCSGVFNSVGVIKRRRGDVNYPTCNKCGCAPELMRIRAKVMDQNNQPAYVDLRHHDGQRLTEINDVLGILNQVDREIELGIFDVKQYVSKKRRDNFIFSNFIHLTTEKDHEEGYLENQRNREARGEIGYYGMKNKLKYCRVLEKHFGDVDITTIDEAKIDEFKSSFTDKFSNMRGGLIEMGVILKFAYKRKKIARIPLIDNIPTSKTRETILDIQDARSYIQHIQERQYRIIFLLHTQYAWRTCETRAIMKKECDTILEKVMVRRHFSGPRLTEGRKSIKKGAKAELEFDMVNELKKWIEEDCRWLGPDDYIFQQMAPKNRHDRQGGFMPKPGGLPLGESTLPKVWRKTLEDLGVPHVEMYEIRGARGTEIAEQSNGNMLVTRDFMGHTNTKTTEKHYVRNKNVSGKYIDKDAEIIPIAR